MNKKLFSLLLCLFSVLFLLVFSNISFAQGGRYGGAVLSPQSPVATLSGVSGGQRPATKVGRQCRGYIDTRPDHVIRVTSPMILQISGNSANDITLVIAGPGGVRCDDDSGGGTNPLINDSFAPGEYRIFVGSYAQGQNFQYTLNITSTQAPPPPHGGLGLQGIGGGATYGSAVVSPQNPVANLNGVSGGQRNASGMGNNCRGFIANTPDHLITVTAGMNLSFRVNSGGDTTLVIVGPGGTRCDDDSGGNSNPLINGYFSPGTYQVFVGSYSQSNNYNYSLNISQTGGGSLPPPPPPPPTGGGSRYGSATVSPGNTHASLSGVSGGPRAANTINGNCRGYIAQDMPDNTITVTATMDLQFGVTANGDTTLVIVGPGGVRCDDDSGGGNNPLVRGSFTPGTYQVYIGSYSASANYNYTLNVSPIIQPVNIPGPNVSGGTYGGAVLSPSNMVATLNGVAGGNRDADSLGSNCSGYIANSPDHIIQVTSPMTLNFAVSSNVDTTLVIIGPGGVTCDDDSGGGFNPRITRMLMPGTYQVFVGTFSQGNMSNYTLTIFP